MILGVLVLVLCDLLNLSDSSPSPLFNLLGGGNDNDNNNGGGCRPGYEYITETTYQTSYQQQCRFSALSALLVPGSLQRLMFQHSE